MVVVVLSQELNSQKHEKAVTYLSMSQLISDRNKFKTLHTYLSMVD